MSNVEQKIDPIPAGFTREQPYFSFSRFLKERFGCRVYRVTVDGSFTCPNVDGTVAVGGCIYCDNRSFSPNRRLPRRSIKDQVAQGITLLEKRYGAERFLAYFQAATNTYAPADKLRRLYDEALDHPQVLGLIVGTRPDCVLDDILDLLTEYAKNRYVCLELGLQSRHDRSLDWMNRGHHVDAFLDAIRRCHDRPFDICVHIILGLPGESREDMLSTVDLVASAPVQAIKIHNLHVVRNTPLEDLYRSGKVSILELPEYVDLVADALEMLPPTMVIHRLNGDAPPDYLVAPTWCLDKGGFLRALVDEMSRRQSWQGKKHARKGPLSVVRD